MAITSEQETEKHTSTQQKGWSGIAWAVLGIALIVVACNGYARWITSDAFGPIPTGPDTFPLFNLIAHRAFEAISIVGCSIAFWYIVVRPWRESGAPTFAGLLVLGAFPAVYVDQMINYVHFTGAFNAYAVQWGGWGAFIPGAAQLIHPGEPLLWTVPQFVIGPAAALLGVKYINALRKRWPGISNVIAFLALAPVLWLTSFVMEVGILFKLTQAGAYVRTIESLTLWAGELHQFPIYEPLLFSTWVLGYVYLHLTYQDRGKTFLHSGLLRISGPKARTFVLFLAIAGFEATWAVTAYFGPWAIQSIFADSILTDLPSYLDPASHTSN